MTSSIPNQKREPNDDELANFGSLQAMIMPLLQQLQGNASGGMNVQAPQAPAGSSFFPRGQLDALRGLLEGPPNVPAVPHFRQQLAAARGGDPRDSTPKKNSHFR